MSCPKLRLAISFLDKFECVTGASAFTRIEDTKTSSNTSSSDINSIIISSSFCTTWLKYPVLKPM